MTPFAAFGIFIKWIACLVGKLGPAMVVPIVVIAALAPIVGYRGLSAVIKTETTFSSGPSRVHFSKIENLVVLQVRFADILKAIIASNNSEAPRPAGEWVVYGRATYYVDLQHLEVLQIDRQLKSATVRLPPITVVAEVDHEQSRDLAANFPFGSSKIRDAALASVGKQMERLIRHKAMQPEYLGIAMDQAQSAIISLYAPFGWNVSVEWRESQPFYDAGDVQDISP